MATFIADEQGKVWIEHSAGDVKMRFAIGGVDGTRFQPGATVEIADERIADVVAKLGASFGLASGDGDGH